MPKAGRTKAELAAENGRSPSSEDWRRADEGRPCYQTVCALFGSFVAAREAAGLSHGYRQRRGSSQKWAAA